MVNSMWQKQTNEITYTVNVVSGNSLKRQVLICVIAGLISGLIYGVFLGKHERPMFERYARLQGISFYEKPLTAEEQKEYGEKFEKEHQRAFNREQQLIEEACAKDKNSWRCKQPNSYDLRLKTH